MRGWRRYDREIYRMLDGRVDASARHLISGWAADADRPDDRVDVVVLVDGHERGRARADLPRVDLQGLGTLGDGAHGFTYAFDPPLSPLRTYEIAVCHAGTDMLLRLGQFSIAAEASHAVERTRPIMVTTSGQPGFIDLMRSLAGDKGIVAADSHAYGVKLMTYYAHALAVLVAPASRVPARHVTANDDGACVLTPNPFHAPDYEHLFPEPRLFYAFFRTQSETTISAAFKAVVTGFYETLAMHQDKPMAGYFAEQCDLFDVARDFARLAFTDMREIVLLQDPRDAYCVYRALWSTSPSQAMATLSRVRDRAVELRRENRGDTMFLRCEDLRLRPEGTLLEISRFLSLDHAIIADPETFRTEAADPATLGIGQWKTDLDGKEIALFEREFGEYLELFGYEASRTAGA
jgi:hypothetical protein